MGENSLFITCPVCGEELEVEEEALKEFEVGDVVICEACSAELEVVSLDPPEFALLGLLTTCPNCGAELELEETELEEGQVVTCANCQTQFEIEFEDEPGRPQA